MNDYISTTHNGYSNHHGGYSGAFSWWRNTLDYRFWTVNGHGAFTKDGLAVCDDFGNLVEVTA